MTLFEMKNKVLGLIEELNPDSELLTDDPDIATKINSVINDVMLELCRFKKLPGYVEIEAKEGDLITFEDIERESTYAVYQLDSVKGSHELKAQGTIIKCLEDCVLEINFFRYPESITDKTKDKAYEFELSSDALGLLPYGVAADLLKSDVSTEYGTIYATRYETMLNRLDPRYNMGTVSFEGGVSV